MPTRRSLLCAAASLAALPALAAAQLPTNQRLYDTTTSMPEVRASRLAKFAAEPVVTGRVIFLGNSITQGGDWAKLTGDSTVVNRGIGADVTFGLRTRLDDFLFDRLRRCRDRAPAVTCAGSSRRCRRASPGAAG